MRSACHVYKAYETKSASLFEGIVLDVLNGIVSDADDLKFTYAPGTGRTSFYYYARSPVRDQRLRQLQQAIERFGTQAETVIREVTDVAKRQELLTQAIVENFDETSRKPFEAADVAARMSRIDDKQEWERIAVWIVHGMWRGGRAGSPPTAMGHMVVRIRPHS